MKKTSIRNLLGAFLVISLFLSAVHNEAFSRDLYRVAAALSLQLQTTEGRGSDAEARKAINKKRVGILALFWLTVFLLLMMFFLSVMLLFRRRWRKAPKEREETVLEDLWWKKKEDEEEEDQSDE